MDVKKTKCKKYLEQSRLNRGEPKFKDIYGHMHFNNMNIPLHQCPQLTKFTSNSIVTRQQGPLLEFPKYNLTIYNRTKWYTGTLVAVAAAELLKPVGIIDCIEFHVCLTNKKSKKSICRKPPKSGGSSLQLQYILSLTDVAKIKWQQKPAQIISE